MHTHTMMIVNRLWQTMPQMTIRRSCMPLYLICLIYLFLLPIGGPGSFSDLAVKDEFGHHDNNMITITVLYFFVSCRLSLIGLAICIIVQILNKWMINCFYTTDVTHLKPYVEDRRWMELNNAIDVMILEARPHSDGGTRLISTTTSSTLTATHRNTNHSSGRLKLPVSFLFRVLEQGAPYYIIEKILSATPGLASHGEDVASIAGDYFVDDVMVLFKQRKRDKRYPIHVACEATTNNNNDTPQIIRALINDYPDGVREVYGGSNGYDRLPIHLIVKSAARDYNEDNSDGNNNSSTTTKENDMLDVIKMLIHLYPKGLEHYGGPFKHLPLHIVIHKMFYYGTHPCDKANYYCYKMSNVLLEVALIMLRVYPQAAARCRFPRRRDEPSEYPLHEAIRHMVLISYELNNELRLLKALVEAYPKAAVTQKGSRTSIFHTFILHTFCIIEHTDDETPSSPITYSKDYVDAFYSIFNAYPEAAKHKNRSGHLPIHMISSRRIIPLFILRALVQAYPQSLYEGVNMNFFYSTTNHSSSEHPPLFTYFFNKLAALYAVDSHNKNSSNNSSSAIKKKNFLETSGWKDVITYIVHATYLYDTNNHTSRNNNNNNNGLLLEGGQSIPTLHGSIYYRAPYDAIKQIICWYPTSVTEVDQFGMLPFHYACLPPSPTTTVIKSSSSSSAKVSNISVTVDGSTTSSPIKKNNKKEDDGTSKASTLEQMNIILLLLLHNPNVLQGLI